MRYSKLELKICDKTKQNNVVGSTAFKTRLKEIIKQELARSLVDKETTFSYERTLKPQSNTYKMNQSNHPGYFTEAGSKAKAKDPTFSEDEDDPNEIPYTKIPWPETLWKM